MHPFIYLLSNWLSDLCWLNDIAVMLSVSWHFKNTHFVTTLMDPVSIVEFLTGENLKGNTTNWRKTWHELSMVPNRSKSLSKEGPILNSGPFKAVEDVKIWYGCSSRLIVTRIFLKMFVYNTRTEKACWMYSRKIYSINPLVNATDDKYSCIINIYIKTCNMWIWITRLIFR